MIVDRTIINAKWGRIDELKELFKSMMVLQGDNPNGPKSGRVLTDLSGKFFRLIVESEFENLAAWEAWRSTMFSDPAFGESFGKISELCETGSQEFYTVEYSVP